MGDRIDPRLAPSAWFDVVGALRLTLRLGLSVGVAGN